MVNRNYLWDNIKGFLILTVVIGHLLHSFNCTVDITYNFAYWIYTFHMPAFLFVSGFWAKSYCNDQGVVKPIKVAYLIGYYVVFQTLFLTIDKLFLNHNKPISYFDSMIGLWYLCAMIFYYLVIPIFKKLHPAIGISVTVVLSLLIGCEAEAGSFMSISRCFVFAPYFFTGYYLSTDSIDRVRSIKNGWVPGIICGTASVSLWLFADRIFKDTFIAKFGTFTPSLFYGHSSYDKMGFSTLEGFYIRLISYVISALMIIALLFITPKCKNILSHIGKNSLQIYTFHLILILLFIRLKGKDINLIVIDREWIGLALVVAGVLLTLLLSTKPFSYPFKWIQTLVNKIFSLTEKTK